MKPSTAEVVVTATGRVVRYKSDQVGNDLTAHLAWCATHLEPVWVFSDGSYTCPFDLAVQCPQDDHDLTNPPPWESP